MIDKLSVKDCALCGSCADACPVSAITYETAYKDFSYPKVNPDKCIGCNLCEKVCPVLAGDTREADTAPLRRAYAAKNPDSAVRQGSSSGGVFWAIAQTVLAYGGYVCGVVFDENFRVHHSISNRTEDVRKMMGSKYAQSDLTGIYKIIRELLGAGELVLFTGCPCQVAALHQFLGKDYENLITVDIICHGVPSNTMLRAYLDYQEKKHRSKIETVCFRDKKHGWHNSSIKIGFANRSVYCAPITADAFMKGYFGAIVLKESCYSCAFKNFRAGSDMTMGDFWGAEAVRPELDDNTGLSAVIANTGKGDAFLHQCGLELWEEQLNTVVRYNRNLIAPTKKNPERDRFYVYAQTNGYAAAIRDLLTEPPLKRLRREGRYLLRCICYFIMGRGKPLY